MATSAALLWRQFRLERRLFWRNPSAAFFNFLLPLLLLAIFGAAFSNNQHDLDVIVPGIAGMSVMSATFVALAYNVTFLRESGVLKRMRGTPLPGSVYLGGLAGNAIANTVTQVTIIVVAGKLFFHVPWPRDWGELVLFVAAGVVCFATLGVALAHAIPNFDSAPAYVNATFLPVILISGVFYDVKHVPQFLRSIADGLPLKHLIDGLSGAMVSGRGLSHNLSALAVIGVWALIGVALAVRGFSWDQRRE
jgi:ABC-2 type transport system permease protein